MGRPYMGNPHMGNPHMGNPHMGHPYMGLPCTGNAYITHTWETHVWVTHITGPRSCNREGRTRDQNATTKPLSRNSREPRSDIMYQSIPTAGIRC